MDTQYEELISKATIALASKQYDLALLCCKKAVNINPQKAVGFSLSGDICVLGGKTPQAEVFYRKAISISPQDGELYVGLGNSLYGQKKYTEALKSYALAEQMGCSDKSRKKIYYLMGLICQAHGKKEEALVNYKKADEIAGDFKEQKNILLNRIQLFIEINDLDNAENDVRQYLYLVPNEFKSYQLLFQVQIGKKAFSEAETTLNEAIQYCPMNEQNKIDYVFDLAMLDCFMAEQQPDKEKLFYDSAVNRLNGLNSNQQLSKELQYEIIVTQAEITMKLGNTDEAIQLLKKVADEPDSDILEQQKCIDRARFSLIEWLSGKQIFGDAYNYARTLKNSKNAFYRHNGYYFSAFLMKQMAGKKPDLKKRAKQLYNEAIAYFKSVLASNHGDVTALTFRIKCLADVEKYDNAIELSKILPEKAQKAVADYIQKCRS